MSAINKGLGRGLNALFNSNTLPDEKEKTTMASPLNQVKIDDIIPNPKQPRQSFNEESLQELANSIRIKGILQPILVRPAQEEGKWEIIAGERRWRAAKMAGLEEVPVLVRDFDQNDALIATMMENMHRDNLNALEEAQGLAAIMEMLSLNQTELANALGAQRGSISNILRVLRLSPQAKDDLLHNRISQGHARCLVTLPEQESEILRQRIIDAGMSVRATEMALSFWNQTKQFPWQKPQTGERKGKLLDPDMKNIAQRLTKTLNCPAKINGTTEKGKIHLSYHTNGQLFELLEKLGLTMKDLETSEE